MQAAVNFETPFRQVFPGEFLRESASAPVPDGGTILVLNAKHLYPGPERVVLPQRYTELKRAPHPLQFLPYQYEGYDPAQRAALRAADISMQRLAVDP